MSIRVRLSLSFILIVVVTVVTMEFLLFSIIQNRYYDNLQQSMCTQIKISSDFYERFYSDSSLYDNVLYNIDTFWNKSRAMVQIYDLDENLIMDSEGIGNSSRGKATDLNDALKGKMGIWKGSLTLQNKDSGKPYRENVMAVSYPLKSGGKIIGALRFLSSLKNINSEINILIVIFIVIGVLVIIFCSFISAFLAHYIVVPLKLVTKAAEKMAAGNFHARCKKINIEEIQKLSQTLNFMADEILKKDQLKNDFISSISHELRTPLTAIKGWAITLKEVNISDRKMLLDGLDIIENESNRLTAMVEELLDFSKIISGNMKISKERVDLRKILENLRIELMPRGIKENINLSIEYSENLPFLHTDRNRLKQVFLNILDNAFKFTPSGGSIRLSAEVKEKSIIFTISDTGCGIAEEEIPKVKEKFYKGKNSKSQNGIGLSICDEIIKLFSGTLEIKSELDIGTEVIITLPAGEANNQ